MIEWTATKDEEGLPPLQWLRQRIPAAPQAYLRQLLRGGKIRSEEGPLAGNTAIRAGQRLFLPESARMRELLSQGGDPNLKILYETREILVVEKPPGLAVHRGKGHEQDNLTDRVNALLRRLGAPFTAAPVHRLDLETSGPLVFGKGRKGASALGKLFMEETVEKIYLALAWGSLPPFTLLDSPVKAKGKVKAAATACELVAEKGGISLLRLRLHSGRTHQIRRQLADRGAPLVGDSRYGGRALPDLARIFLHCCLLRLPDPFGGPEVTVESPLGDDLKAALQRLGLPEPG